ncbi:MAG TPA: AzlD domain-containing protein [Bacillota bacterium]
MKVLWLVAGMAIVTYLPRLIPFLLITERPLPAYWQRFLKLLPYTALGALIFPGTFQAIPGKPEVALMGLICAGLCSWLNGGIILSILAAIIAVLVGLGKG